MTTSGGFNDTVDLTTTVVGNAPARKAVLSTSSLIGSGSVQLTVGGVGPHPAESRGDVSGGRHREEWLAAAFGLCDPRAAELLPARSLEVFVDESSSSSLPAAVNPVNGFQDQVEMDFDAGLPNGVSAALSDTTADSSGTPVQLDFDATADAGTGLFLVTLIGRSGTSVAATQAGAGRECRGRRWWRRIAGRSHRRLQQAAHRDRRHAVLGRSHGEQRLLCLLRESAEAGAKPRRGAVRPGAAQPARTGGGNGQHMALPEGSFTDLWLLAAAINGAQLDQNLILLYTDRTGVALTQSFSDWDYPQSYRGEIEAVAMPYRALGNGGMDGNNIQNLYAYRFPIDPTKTLASLTLPSNPNVIVHAITLLGPSASEVVSDGGKGAPPSSGCGCSSSSLSPPAEGWGEGTLWLALVLVLRRRRPSLTRQRSRPQLSLPEGVAR